VNNIVLGKIRWLAVRFGCSTHPDLAEFWGRLIQSIVAGSPQFMIVASETCEDWKLVLGTWAAGTGLLAITSSRYALYEGPLVVRRAEESF